MRDTCFATCIKYPSSSLSGREQSCVVNCVDRFMETFNIASAEFSKER